MDLFDPPMKPATLKKALAYLSGEPKIYGLIQQFPHPQMDRKDGTYAALTRSIIYQQLSGKAAGTIYRRYCALFKEGVPTWQEFFRKKRDTMLSAGLSSQKMNYLYDLSCKFRDGFITPEKFPKMTDEEIREHLVAVKGIGVWTADMHLMFYLGRPDVLPTLDLGIKKGFQKLFKLKSMPDHEKMVKLSKAWAPYRTIACWYLWRLSDEGNPNRPK